MAQSLLSQQYKTTIPEEVRERLGASPGDILHWEVTGNRVEITIVQPVLLTFEDEARAAATASRKQMSHLPGWSRTLQW